MLSIQVSILVNKMNEESKQCAEGATRKRLQEKIASLSQPQARRAADALSMIWSYVNGPLKPPVAQPEPTFSMAFTFFLNWHRVELALLKSIATGVFIDVQLCAFSKICNNLPFDPKPLFISSIVIEEWGPAVTTREWKKPPIRLTLICDRRDHRHRLSRRVPGGWTKGRLCKLGWGVFCSCPPR